MPMKLAVFNNKGGVGKTTLSIILTQIAIMRNRKVLAVDQDEQANFYASLRYMKEKKMYPDLFRLDTVIKAEYLNNPSYDLMIIDCAPGFNAITNSAIQKADIILIPVRPDSYGLMHLFKVREKAGDYKYLFQFPLVKVGFDSAQASQEALRKIAGKKYTVIGDLPLHARIPANISSNLEKWWDMGVPTTFRAPFEHLYTRLEKLYETLMKLRKMEAAKKKKEYEEIGGYYDNPENAYIKLWGRKAKS